MGFFLDRHEKLKFHAISLLDSYLSRFSVFSDLFGIFSAPRFAIATFCGIFSEFSEISELFSEFLFFFSPLQVFPPTMPPKNISQPKGNKPKEQNADAQGEHHKPAKVVHQLTPNSKRNAKVDEQQSRQSRQKLIALMKQRNKPNQDAIYQVSEHSRETQESSDNVPQDVKTMDDEIGDQDPFEPEVKTAEAPTSNELQNDSTTTDTRDGSNEAQDALGDLQLPDIIQPDQQSKDHGANIQPDQQGQGHGANTHGDQREDEPDPIRQLLFDTPNKSQEAQSRHEGAHGDPIQDDQEKKHPNMESQVHLNQEANKTSPSVTLPLPLSNSIEFQSPTEYVKYVEGTKPEKGPPIQTFTYLYSSSTEKNAQNSILVNSYSKLLPVQALQSLWEIESWKLHIGGDELNHAFQVPALKGEDLSQCHYSPYMARPHKNLVALLKTHHTFYLQPPRFNQVPHGWGEDVLTETSWVEDIVKAIEDVVKTSHIKPRGWLVFESNDPNIKARDLLGSQNHVKYRILRKHVATIQMFTRVAPQVPRWQDSKVSRASMLVQSTPFIAILLRPFANEAGTTLPIAPRDHALSAGFPRHRFLESMEVDASMPETHLRMDIHPKLMSQEHKLTTRDFYLFINTYFAPNGPNVEWNTNNAVYPFDNALLTVFPQRNPRAPIQNDGYIRIDYKLPSVIASLLMRTIVSSQLFLTGRVFAIDMADFSNSTSFFVQPTRDLLSAHPGQCNPIEMFSAVLGHVPGGSKNIKVLGSALRTGSSIVFLVDLSSLPAGNGLTQEQTLSRHLFFQVGLLMYRTANATLVRHTQRTPAWSLLPTTPAAIVKAPAKEANSPQLVYLQCPDSVSTRDLKITAALIGQYEKFGFHSSLGQCTSLYSVTYSHTDSVALAHKLTIEDVVFIPNVELPQRKSELLILDGEVNELDRELVATINAGAKLGSRDAIMHLQELERRIMDVVEKMSMSEWHVETPPMDDPMQGQFEAKPHFVVTKSNALRAGCVEAAESRYAMSPSKYNPSPKALQLAADMEHMIHVEAPEGLTFIPNFITEEEEKFLVDWAETFEWDHDVPTRDTAQFGFKFNYDTHEIEKGRPWPKELESLAERLKPYFKGKPVNQCIVNRTKPPQGFGRHFDNSKFDDPVATLCTNSGVNIIFIHKDGRHYHAMRSQRRSLIVMSGESRYEYQHAIPEGVDDAWKGKLIPRNMRISWTLRSMRDLSKYDDL